jgi:hypothetical protein
LACRINVKGGNMKRFTIIIFLLALYINAFSQDEDLQMIFDSIIAEADLMYKYEKLFGIQQIC